MRGFLGGFIAAALIATGALWLARGSGLRIDLSRPAVVSRIQQLQRLETVVYGMDKIVSGGQESRFLPRPLAGERILLIVYGEVTAGIDLSHLTSDQLQVDGRKATLSLPAAEIFSTRIDNSRTKVYARETGLFTSPDPNLESEVRREAEQQIRQAALDGNILPTAKANAQQTLMTFLKGLGFEQIEIR